MIRRTHRDTSGHIGTHRDTSGHIGTHRDTSGHIGTHRDTSGHIGTHRDTSGCNHHLLETQVYAPQTNIWPRNILCSPKEDFGRIDKRRNPDFRYTFQCFVAQIEFSRPWNVLRKSGFPLLSIIPKSSFGMCVCQSFQRFVFQNQVLTSLKTGLKDVSTWFWNTNEKCVLWFRPNVSGSSYPWYLTSL